MIGSDTAQESQLNKQTLKEFDRLFYPRSIAIVGAFDAPRDSGAVTLKGLSRAGFRGAIALCTTSSPQPTYAQAWDS